MKRWIVSIVALVFLLTVSSCKNNEDDETKTATVTGYIYLSDTIPAPGVHVYDRVSQSYSGYTDRNGFFRVSVPVGARTIVIDGGIFRTEVSVSLSEGEVRELYSSSSPFILTDGTKFKIAVMLGAYDSIQAVFEQIGISRINSPDDSISGYVLYDFSNFPTDLETLKKFNLLAFNCNLMGPSISSVTLKEYIQQGGNIYASDWQYWVIDSLGLSDRVFLYNDNGDYATGSRGTIEAEIIDDVLKSQLGKDSVTIVFDHDGWVVIDSVKSDVKALLKANASTSGGANITDAPLVILAKLFNDGGTLLYTSFHYEAQATSEDVIDMLRMFLVRIGQN